MKRALTMVMSLMIVIVFTAVSSWSEEATFYDGKENWILRTYTEESGGNYSVILEVVNTTNNIITDPIIGMSSNPLQLTDVALAPDVSLAFDENKATAYLMYTASGGGVAMQPVTDISRDHGVISVSSNPITFGDVKVGAVKKKTLKVINTGYSPLILTAITIEYPFTIMDNTTCVAEKPIISGGSCKILVQFVPTAAIVYNGNLLLNSAEGNININLLGAGLLK